MTPMRLIFALVLPAVILGGALALTRQPALIPASVAGLKVYGPWAALAVASALGLAFNRGRIVFAAAALAIAYAAFRSVIEPGGGDLAARAAYAGACVLVPVALAGLAWLEERGVLNVHGALRAAALGAACAFVAWIIWSQRASTVDWAYAPLAAAPLLPATPIPQLGLAALVLGLVAAVAAGFVRRSPIDAGLAWAIAAFAVALHAFRMPLGFAAFTTAAAAMLVVAVLRDSHRMAFRDELTGLPGRRALNEGLKATGRSYALAMVDVDHFKQFNDTHGHDVGDQVLKMVAARLAGVGGGGRAFRYGGEEFTILFAGKDAAEALPYLEDLRADIARYRMALRSSDRPRRARSGKRRRGAPAGARSVSVTVSIGVAARTEKYDHPEAVIRAADKALYRAKRAGRNRVEGA